MTKQEILTKAIEKAEANGFLLLRRDGLHVTRWDVAVRGFDTVEPYIRQHKGEIYMREVPWQVVVFHHEFAKTLWPGDGYELCGSYAMGKLWQCRLQEMVIEDDPIAYLGEHLDY